MSLYSPLRRALSAQDGRQLAFLFSPDTPETRQFAFSTNQSQVRRDTEFALSGIQSIRNGITDKGEAAWIETCVAYFEVAYSLEHADKLPSEKALGYWASVYTKQKDFALAVMRGYSNGNWPNWTIPVLYTACRYLRTIAIAADTQEKKEGRTADKLEDAARHLNRAFTLCISDRAPLEDSRKWGTYYIINLLFKTYFKLNAITLSKNVLRALGAITGDMPALESFPKSHIVTFKYYVGVISFLEENYAKAEENLFIALKLCKSDAIRNKELILTYLIPAHLITTHQIPTSDLFSQYPRLKALFEPITSTIKSGNILAFDAALEANEDEFVKRRIYLTLERGRDIALRNLFRTVFLINDKKTRIPVEEFRRAMGFSMAGRDGGMKREVEPEETECLLAGMIYKGLMKGYVSREKSMVVLSNKEAFPGTGT